MNKGSGKNRKVVKGMPSAVVLSIVIHAALFMLAGMLVIFTVVKKEDKPKCGNGNLALMRQVVYRQQDEGI